MRDMPRVGDVWSQQKAYKMGSTLILIVPAEDDSMRGMNLETGEVYDGTLQKDSNMFPWRLWLEAE